MRFLASELAIGFYGALSAEIRRHPHLSRAFWELGPGRTRANLAGIIAAAARRGEICVVDAFEAADALFGLWQGFSNLQLALDIGPDDVRATIDRRVDRGIAMFMTIYGQSTPRTEV